MLEKLNLSSNMLTGKRRKSRCTAFRFLGSELLGAPSTCGRGHSERELASGIHSHLLTEIADQHGVFTSMQHSRATFSGTGVWCVTRLFNTRLVHRLAANAPQTVVLPHPASLFVRMLRLIV